MDQIEILEYIKMKLSNIDKKIEKIFAPNSWIEMNEAADYTGLSGSTIQRAVTKGILKASKKTGKTLFKRSELDRWLYG